MNPFQSLHEYEEFIYSLQNSFPTIQRSTLVIIQRSRGYAELSGEIHFGQAIRLNVYERLVWSAAAVRIQGYSYEVWQNEQQLYWYDSQPHQNEPTLAGTNPHHKHVQPDIKHNRIPAPGLSFSQPNLPFLIDEIQALLQNAK